MDQNDSDTGPYVLQQVIGKIVLWKKNCNFKTCVYIVFDALTMLSTRCCTVILGNMRKKMDKDSCVISSYVTICIQLDE
jgi:hypothetical protein